MTTEELVEKMGNYIALIIAILITLGTAIMVLFIVPAITITAVIGLYQIAVDILT